MDCNYAREQHLLVSNIHAGSVTIASTVRLLGGDGSHWCAELQHNLQEISNITAHSTFLVLIIIIMYMVQF